MIQAILSKGNQVLTGSGTILDLCVNHSIPLASSCGGKSICGKCIVMIHEGQSQLSAPSQIEQVKLTQLKCPENTRLGCQIHTDDITGNFNISTTYW
ncbi:MAG: 2Fe-2S iron-sulfur cluster-binding protein [Holophagaceae bacterium]